MKQESHLHKWWNNYRKTSNISRTLVGNKIVDNSDVVGASPVGAAPATSSFSTWHLASMDWAKTTARGDKKHLSFGFWCDLYQRFYGNVFFLFAGRQLPCWCHTMRIMPRMFWLLVLVFLMTVLLIGQCIWDASLGTGGPQGDGDGALVIQIPHKVSEGKRINCNSLAPGRYGSNS